MLTIVIYLGDEPPSRFRVFRAGVNPTSKGEINFDDRAAARVLAAFTRDGIDLAIDLEHLSLNPDCISYDPDARGWIQQLAVIDGELWAENVKWTADGATRITEKRQRYISPVTHSDAEGLESIFNMALVAVPATVQPQALIAASKNKVAPVKRSANTYFESVTTRVARYTKDIRSASR